MVDRMRTMAAGPVAAKRERVIGNSEGEKPEGGLRHRILGPTPHGSAEASTLTSNSNIREGNGSWLSRGLNEAF